MQDMDKEIYMIMMAWVIMEDFLIIPIKKLIVEKKLSNAEFLL